jgi:hypothetical protein
MDGFFYMVCGMSVGGLECDITAHGFIVHEVKSAQNAKIQYLDRSTQDSRKK